MRQQVDLISRNVGAYLMSFTPNLFRRLQVQLIMIKDYPYVRDDFLGDRELIFNGVI